MKLVHSINRFQTISHAPRKTKQTPAVELTAQEQEKLQAEFRRFLSNARHAGRYDLILHWSARHLSQCAIESTDILLHDQLKVLLAECIACK